ncbi:acyl-CoA thioesterase [Sphingomonas sp. YL-JM2C]
MTSDGNDETARPPEDAPLVRAFPMPGDLNSSGVIFGGWLLGHIDQAGGSIAWRRAKGRCLLANIDVALVAPVLPGDEVSFHGQEVRRGRSSLHVAITAWRRPRTVDGAILAAKANLVFVAVDEHGRPRLLSA